MTTTTITQCKTITEILLVWDGQRYFLTRIRPSGRTEPKTASQAAEILQLNEDEPGIEISSRGEGPVQIGSSWAWSWLAKITTISEEEPA